MPMTSTEPELENLEFVLLITDLEVATKDYSQG